MSSIKTRKSLSAIPAVLLSMISVQGGASIAKSLFPVLGAGGTSSLRIGLSAVILFVFNRPKLSKITSVQWLHCLGYGFCLAVMNLVFYYAIKRIPLGLGVAVEFVGPLTLALLSSRKILDILWAFLAFLGIMLIVPWQQDNGIDILGLSLALLAGVFWACYIVLGGKTSKIMEGREAVTVGMGFATLFIVPFGIISGDLYALNWYLLLIGLGVAVLSSAIPFTLDFIAFGKIPAKTFSILMSLHPVFGALSGLLFLNEHLTLNQWLSIFCIIIASMGATISVKKTKKIM